MRADPNGSIFRRKGDSVQLWSQPAIPGSSCLALTQGCRSFFGGDERDEMNPLISRIIAPCRWSG